MKSKQFGLAEFITYTTYFCLVVGCFSLLAPHFPKFPYNVIVLALFVSMTGGIIAVATLATSAATFQSRKQTQQQKEHERKGNLKWLAVGMLLFAAPIPVIIVLIGFAS